MNTEMRKNCLLSPSLSPTQRVRMGGSLPDPVSIDVKHSLWEMSLDCAQGTGALQGTQIVIMRLKVEGSLLAHCYTLYHSHGPRQVSSVHEAGYYCFPKKRCTIFF